MPLAYARGIFYPKSLAKKASQSLRRARRK